MVNTPFVMTPAQQVLVKGVQLSLDNLADIIDYIEEQFHILENKIADVVALALDQIELQTVSLFQMQIAIIIMQIAIFARRFKMNALSVAYSIFRNRKSYFQKFPWSHRT